MWIKIAINSILVISLSLLQMSFIGGLPFPFSELNLLIVFLVFFQALSKNFHNIWMFILIGFIFDIFFIPTINIFLLVWPATFTVSYLLFSNLFTNRSLFSLLATCCLTTFFFLFASGTLIYLSEMFRSGADLFFLSEDFWSKLSFQILLNSSAVTIFFYIFNFLSNRLRPVFMIKY